MWRTIFAMAHVDGVVSAEEIRFMAEVLEDIEFSEEQKNTLRDDIHIPKDIIEMFGKITDPKYKLKFFEFARDLVWVDGDYGQDEQKIMLELFKKHMQDVDFDAMVGHVDLELEGESGGSGAHHEPRTARPKSVIQLFRQKFMD